LHQICESIKEQEAHIPGSLARICILAVLHFDFHEAMCHSNFSDTSGSYKEEATNI